MVPFTANEKRINSFRDTVKQCRSNDSLRSDISQSIRGQRVFWENEKLDFMGSELNNCIKRHDGKHTSKISVNGLDTFSAALNHVAEGKTTVLNFANFFTPGGAVEYGANAQEEALCRTSTLYVCLTDDKDVKTNFYLTHEYTANGLKEPERERYGTMHNNDCVYTPNVVIFKDPKTEENLLTSDYGYVNVISCAAPNFAGQALNTETLKSIYTLQLDRIHRILEVAYSQGTDHLILGAFGCGVFNNDPEMVAMAARDAIEIFTKKHPNAFENIEFAILDSTGEKREIFERVLLGEQKKIDERAKVPEQTLPEDFDMEER